MTAPTYFDQDEMTRPGHEPSLTSDCHAWYCSCSCGYVAGVANHGQPHAPMIASAWRHVAAIDANAAAGLETLP